MLNPKDIFSIMTEDEKDIMSLLCQEREGVNAQTLARKIHLNNEEKELCTYGNTVKAIYTLRNRTGLKLMACKIAVDTYMGWKR